MTMKYVEQLARLEPSTSSFIGSQQDSGSRDLPAHKQMLRDAAKKNKCVCCKGKKYVKKAATDTQSYRDAPEGHRTCDRCFGSGKWQEGSQKGTRAAMQPGSATVEQIADLTQGMEPHIFRAGVFYATKRFSLIMPLVDDVQALIVAPKIKNLEQDNQMVLTRSLGLARVAVHNLRFSLDEQIDKTHGSTIMCCTEDEWLTIWADAADDISGRLRGWVKQADNYMRDRFEIQLEEVG